MVAGRNQAQDRLALGGDRAVRVAAVAGAHLDLLEPVVGAQAPAEVVGRSHEVGLAQLADRDQAHVHQRATFARPTRSTAATARRGR